MIYYNIASFKTLEKKVTKSQKKIVILYIAIISTMSC